MSAFKRFKICALYLNRGISPALPTETPNPHLNIDGYSLEIRNTAEIGSIDVHPKYNWPGSDVTLIADNVAYMLHRSRLCTISEIFHKLFEDDNKSYRKSSSAIYLPGCHSENIEAALLHIYPAEPGVTIATSRDQWQLIYDFAYAFEFDSLWISACQNLKTDIDPIDKIRIGRRRGWTNVLSQGLEDFSRSSRRAPSPGSEDAALLGYDGLRTIMELRLQRNLSLRIPPAILVPITDVPPIARASTTHEESATGSRVRFSPVETFFDASCSTIISDSTTRVDESPLLSSTATHHSLFIPGFLQVPTSLSEIYQDTEEHRSGRRGTSRTNRSLVPKIVEIFDSTEINALPQLPTTHEINDSAINVVIPSPSSSSVVPYIRHQLVENSRITPLNKRPFIEEPKMVPAENQGSTSGAEADDAARTVEHLLPSSLAMSALKEEIEEVMGGLLVTSSAAEIIPLVEQHIEYSGPPPPLSLPLGEGVHILTPPRSAQPELFPGVVPGPTKGKDVAPVYLVHNPADEYEAISRFSVDVGKFMTQLPQSTPKTVSFQTPLESPSSNNPEMVDVVPFTCPPSGNSGHAAAQANPNSSFHGQIMLILILSASFGCLILFDSATFIFLLRFTGNALQLLLSDIEC